MVRRSVFWMRCAARGLHPRSLLKYRLGQLNDLRWHGRALGGPDMKVVWDHAAPIIAGEFATSRPPLWRRRALPLLRDAGLAQTR